VTAIAIVGAGFSGTLLAFHLLRRTPPSTQIHLIERNSRFGHGAAYSTGNPSHLLNVPAGRMSAFHDRPSHFIDWLRDQEPPPIDLPVPSESTFVPRRIFGAYIRNLLKQELRRPENADRLHLLHGDVLELNDEGDRQVLSLDRGRTVTVDMTVLAIGNFPPEAPPGVEHDFLDGNCYRADPWAPETLSNLSSTAPVLLIGTGLTTVDLVMSLLDQGHTGQIHALSRRGLLPRQHDMAAGTPPPIPRSLPTHLVTLTHYLRQRARSAKTTGCSWQPIVDELRPFTVDVWTAFSQEERQRFLRHLRPWWDVHRHRIAPAVAARIEQARASGQFQIHAGRLHSLSGCFEGVTAAFRRRFTGEEASLTVQRVVNCSGPGCDYDRIPHPLVRNLLDSGLVRPDPLRLGLDVTGNCALKDGNGAISRRLFAIGPVTKGAFWEMTAVPDIRRQCEFLATYIATLIKPSPAAK
jgi:uncharacterized NAD(P)/FAD-binding protein YdhS